MKKLTKIMITAAAMATMMVTSAMAAGWQQDATGWKWINDDGTCLTSQWAWLDGNQDGVAECYCFGPDGYMYANTTTPDGYTVDSEGRWVENGNIKMRGAATATQAAVTADTSVSYDPNNYADPNHPEYWLHMLWAYPGEDAAARVLAKIQGTEPVYPESMRTEGDGLGTSIMPISEEALREVRSFLYSFDWRNTSEYERAEKCFYRVANGYNGNKAVLDWKDASNPWGVLTNKQGICDTFANTFINLCRAVGLKAHLNQVTNQNAPHVDVIVYINGIPHEVDPTYGIWEN